MESSVIRERLAGPALAVAASLLALVVLEGGVRARQWILYGTYRSGVHGLTTDRESGLRVPRAGAAVGAIRINALGFRGPELSTRKPAGTIRLAFLGGSTTFCAEASAQELTWPHLVWQGLRERFQEVEFDYVNGGVAGYTVDDSLINLRHRIAPLEPDVVIIYHGTNDLSVDTRRLARRRGLVPPEVSETSLLSRWSLLWYLVEKNVEIWSRQRAATSPEGRLAYDAEELALGFESRLSELVNEAERVAELTAVATFSPRIRRTQSPDERLEAAVTSLYYMPYMTLQGLLRGFEAYNEAVRRAASRLDALLVDGVDEIGGDGEHFVDSVHFTDLGNRRMADRVLSRLLESPRFRSLVESRRLRTLAASADAGGRDAEPRGSGLSAQQRQHPRRPARAVDDLRRGRDDEEAGGR